MKKEGENRTKKTGRPIKNIIKPIKDSPERVVQAIMKSEPKKNWKYEKKN